MEAFRNYGKYYDLLYQDKDYGKEYDVLEEVFRKYAGNMPRTILVIKGRELVEEFKEEHVVRFLFPEEVRHCLEEAGFDLLGIFLS